MKWSPQQDAALRAVSRWLQNPHAQIFRLFGFAGTGKTTLAQTIAENVRGTVVFAAFTGKAALVLKSKGCEGARTIHSLIYKLDRDDGKDPTFKLNRESDARLASLIIIDECSMVDEALGRDLMSFGTKILVLGDPAQLPPVKGGGFFTEATPDVMLTEIHRQAVDNPIIYLSQEVREGRQLRHGTYGSSRILRDPEVQDRDVLDADQVLVGLNATRHSVNKRFREERGFSAQLPGYSEKFPLQGERLVCLRNNRERGLLNGSLWTTLSYAEDTFGDHEFIWLGVSSADGGSEIPKSVQVLKEAFTGNAGPQPAWLRKRFDDFDFGYALTVHKAQGSQWNDVFIFDESRAVTRGDADASRRWLYTAITRAANKLTVVL